MRERVRAICKRAGETNGDHIRLCQLVNNLYESFVGTVHPTQPLIQRIQLLEKHLGIDSEPA